MASHKGGQPSSAALLALSISLVTAALVIGNIVVSLGLMEGEEAITAVCTQSIDISKQKENRSEYDMATFSIPCDWTNSSTATSLKITSPDGTATLTYPTTFEGDLPMNGTDEPLTIMSQEHTRYIVQGQTAGKTSELIRGPVVDKLGNRPYYQYPNGSSAGDVLAAVFASMTLK